MPSNRDAVRWLLKPLELEQRLGYPNTAVAGGVKRWLPQLRDKLVAQAGLAPAAAKRLLEGLEAYAEAQPAQRELLVAEVWNRLAGPEPEPRRATPAPPVWPGRSPNRARPRQLRLRRLPRASGGRTRCSTSRAWARSGPAC
jgi:hypothetical protein